MNANLKAPISAKLKTIWSIFAPKARLIPGQLRTCIRFNTILPLARSLKLATTGWPIACTTMPHRARYATAFIRKHFSPYQQADQLCLPTGQRYLRLPHWQVKNLCYATHLGKWMMILKISSPSSAPQPSPCMQRATNINAAKSSSIFWV